MTIKGLTYQQHRNILEKLVKLAKSADVKQDHSSGQEYTSLMVCFLVHSLTAADCILRLHDSFGDEFFPSTVGYTIVRPMFEIDVTAHYITQDAIKRAHLYIEYENILRKQQMDAWEKHRNSKKSDWHEGIEMVWQNEWAAKHQAINLNYNSVSSHFKRLDRWSGKSLKQMAVEVDHAEAYDIFYADLSSFTHTDVRLANRFLRLNPNSMSWSAQARYPDVVKVFNYAITFLDCFLKLFGREFKIWTEERIKDCWQ